MASFDSFIARPVVGGGLSVPPIETDPGPAISVNDTRPLLDTEPCDSIENSWLRFMCKAGALAAVPLRLTPFLAERVVSSSVDATNESRAAQGLPPITAADLGIMDVVRAGFSGVEGLSDAAVDKVKGLFEGLLPDFGFFGFAVAAILAFFFLVR